MNRVSAASIAAIVIGLVSMAAGSRVLLGFEDPGYLVVVPLVWYNVAAGAVSIATGAALLARRAWARGLAWGIVGAHAVALAAIAVMWATGGAAAESIGAMAFRVVIWIVIVFAASPGARHTT
jgi:hypothetical protein